MKRQRHTHTLTLRDGRKLRYIIDEPNIRPSVGDTSCRNKSKKTTNIPLSSSTTSSPLSTNRSTRLPYIFAFHAMFVCGKSFLKCRNHQKKYSSNTNNNNNCFNDYILVSINRPGYHGSSPVSIGEYNYKDFANDIQQLANHLKVDKFAIVGHSSGGPNALACAYYLSDRVKSIAILAGDPEYYPLYHPQDKQNGDNVCSNNNNNVNKQNEKSTISDLDIMKSPITYPTWQDWFIGYCLPNIMYCFYPCGIRVSNGLKNDYYLERQKYQFETEQIQQPALVVVGDHDTILSNHLSMNVHERLSNSQLQILKGYGHNDLLHGEVLDMVFQTLIQLGTLSSSSKSTGSSSSKSQEKEESQSIDFETKELTSSEIMIESET